MTRTRNLHAAFVSSPLAMITGCASPVDMMGVYFPGWLVAFIVSVAASYAFIIWLGSRPAGKDLADSGLFFVGLVASVALSVWWVCFSHF